MREDAATSSARLLWLPRLPPSLPATYPLLAPSAARAPIAASAGTPPPQFTLTCNPRRGELQSSAMATLSQLHLARAASKSPLPNATVRLSATQSRASLRFTRSATPSLCITTRNAIAQAQDDDDDAAVGSTGELDWWLSPGIVAAGVLTTASPAHALIREDPEEMMRFSPEAWVNIYITTGAWLVLYFLVIPLVVYNYLRLRWYKRTFLETYFQFMLVFVFFPGMLLLAPFINFRRFPKDGTEEP